MKLLRVNRVNEECLHFSICVCVCHPCTGAMLIFSVSFQFLSQKPYNLLCIVLMLIFSVSCE